MTSSRILKPTVFPTALPCPQSLPVSYYKHSVVKKAQPSVKEVSDPLIPWMATLNLVSKSNKIYTLYDFIKENSICS
jgi:hypothetical protein